MELTLKQEETKTEICVICDGQPSHTFDLNMLFPDDQMSQLKSLDDPRAYGQTIYHALFPDGSFAHRVLDSSPKEAVILLVASNKRLDAIPWEYVYGPDGFLVEDYCFVRGLPAYQRIGPPQSENDLHIIAVPSNPLDEGSNTLSIDSEWERLKETIAQAPFHIILERARPPTLEQLRCLVANQRNRVVHFMGHGSQSESGAVLDFENDDGSIDAVTAQSFIRCIRGTVFLVVLNSCVSASTNLADFSNLAAALVRQKIPYALGMRFNIPDDISHAFSRVFFNELARGSLVEKALLQARITLAQNKGSPSHVGIPVLYTSLHQPALGFTLKEGQSKVIDHRPRLDVTQLTPAEGGFQGRIDALKKIGQLLTGDERARLVTIHGVGGQGKTVLAREAVERFAYAWPGGVCAIKLEPLPAREEFVSNLASFLQIDPRDLTDPNQREKQVLDRLQQRRTLIVLDNAETLDEAVKANDQDALYLAQFIRQQLPRSVTLLVTSRYYLGWPGETNKTCLELKGLRPKEGIALFLQRPPDKIDREVPDWVKDQALALHKELEGHPYCLRLLAGRLDPGYKNISNIIADYRAMLQKIEDMYELRDSPHRSLYACIGTSVQPLDAQIKTLLSWLRIFSAPFSAEKAAGVSGSENTQISQQLQILWQRSLLEYEKHYHMHPVVRLYVEHTMVEAFPLTDSLRQRFGMVHARLAERIFAELDSNAGMVADAREGGEDFQKSIEWVDEEVKAAYLLYWGWIQATLGNLKQGIELTKQIFDNLPTQDTMVEKQAINNLAIMYQHSGKPQKAIEFLQRHSLPARMRDPGYKAAVLSNMAESYHQMRQLERAKELYEEALPILQKRGDRAGEAKVLNNLAGVYQHSGQRERALELYKQALILRDQAGDQRGETRTRNNMALLYQDLGQPERSLELLEQVSHKREEMGDRAGEAITLVNKATAHYNLGHYKEALDELNQAQPILHEVGNLADEANAFGFIGQVYSKHGQLDDALKEGYEKALTILRDIRDFLGEAKILSNMAKSYSRYGQNQRALEHLQQALQVLQKVDDRKMKATILSNIGNVCSRIEQPEKALEYLEQALPLCREVNDRKGEAMTLGSMGVAYQKMGRPSLALERYQQALTIQQEENDQVEQALLLNNIAEIYKAMGQAQQAMKRWEQVLSLQQELKNQREEAATLDCMGWFYHHMKQPEQGLKRLQRALDLYRELKDRSGEATTLNNIGVLYRDYGQLDLALEHYQQALSISQEEEDCRSEATSLNNMANIYLDLRQPEQAVDLLEQALPLLREAGDRYGETSALHNLAGAYNALGKPEQAVEHYQQALSIWQKLGNHAGEANTLNNLAVAYQALGQSKQSLDALEQALPLWREEKDRVGEATTLKNIGWVYQQTGQLEQALKQYEKALPILEELSDRSEQYILLRANIALVSQEIHRRRK